MGSRKTVKTSEFRKVLKCWGLELKGKRGSHERWSKHGMTRPVIFQATKKEIPGPILRNNLKTIGKSFEEFFMTLDSL
jgi:predicted RNA binding protein YcfA (HicA-like mRNA interferase family)